MLSEAVAENSDHQKQFLRMNRRIQKVELLKSKIKQQEIKQ